MGLQTKKIKYAEHWGQIELNDLCYKITDGTHHTPTYLQSGIAFISVKDINDDKVDFSKCKYISKEQHKELIQRCHPEKDDLLVTKSGTIGRMAIVPEKPAFSLFVSVALLKNKKHFITTKFLKFCLENFFNSISIDQDIKGGLLKNFHLEDIRLTTVPVVSQAEQHRIVAKIEELFSSLDKGIESLKTAQAQLKVYRQAVLKWAFEGKLSEGSRQRNISENAAKQELKEIRKERELWFKSVRKKLKYDDKLNDETLTEIPKDWVWVKIVETVFNTADDIVDGPFGSNLKNSDYVEGAPVPVISISNIEEGFDKKIRYITSEKFETIKRSAVFPGDIIVAKIGSTYGKTGFYPETMPVGVIPANLLRIHPSKHFNKKLLAHYLQSLVFKKRLDKIMKSTAQPAFNVSMFKELPIPFMSSKEQEFILSEIESRLSICDKIEESISTSLQQAEALRQSILKKAFEGKLVEQDPNDEPASVLLERIKTEREKKAAEQLKVNKNKKTKTNIAPSGRHKNNNHV